MDNLLEVLCKNITDLLPISNNGKRLIILMEGKTLTLAPEILRRIDNIDCVSEYALPFINTEDYDGFAIVSADSYTENSSFCRVIRILLGMLSLDKDFIRKNIVVLLLILPSNIFLLDSLPISYVGGDLTNILYKIPRGYSLSYKEFLANEISRRVFDRTVPIFSYSCVKDVEFLINQVKETLLKQYPEIRGCSSYEILREDKTITGYSVIIDGEERDWGEGTNASFDFAKLRFYSDEEKLYISPLNISSISDPQSSRLFRIDFHNIIRESILASDDIKCNKDILKHEMVKTLGLSDGYELTELGYDIKEQKLRTLALMTNWVQGFLMMHCLQKDLNALNFYKKDFESEQVQNLFLLIGNRAELFMKSLLDWIKTKEENLISAFDIWKEELGKRRAVSVNLNLGYSNCSIDSIKNSKTVKEAVDSIFRNMHNKIGKSLSKPSKYGSNYRDLRSYLIRFMKMDRETNTNFTMLLNKALDEGICNCRIKTYYHKGIYNCPEQHNRTEYQDYIFCDDEYFES